MIRKTYVDTPGGQVHAHIVDGIQPAIVFLHQTATSAASYDALLGALDMPNQLVAIDTPGFGGSYDPQGWPTLADYAAAVLAAIDALASIASTCSVITPARRCRSNSARPCPSACCR